MKNITCVKYDRKINDEVAAALALSFNEMIARALDGFFRPTEEGRKYLVDGSLVKTVYPAISVMNNMRFTYLCSLYEAFIKEYISVKSDIALREIHKEVLNKYKSEWDALKNEMGSRSVLNLRYVDFVFTREYGFSISDGISDATKEMGDLRDVIVHDGGKIENEYYLTSLRGTLKLLELPSQIGTVVKPTETIMWIYINDIRKIIAICDQHS